MSLNPCSNIAVLEREHIHMYEFIWEISAIIGDAFSVTTWIQSAEGRGGRAGGIPEVGIIKRKQESKKTRS